MMLSTDCSILHEIIRAKDKLGRAAINIAANYTSFCMFSNIIKPPYMVYLCE